MEDNTSTSDMSEEEQTEMSLGKKPDDDHATSSPAKYFDSEPSEGKPEDIATEKPEDIATEINSAENSQEKPHEENAVENPVEIPAVARVVPTKFTEKRPLDLAPYIEKYSKVLLARNISHVGFIHSIDPVTHSIILSVPKEEGIYQTILIPGTSVLEVTITSHDSSIIPPKRKKVQKPSEADLQRRKSQILSWFKENRLPVTEEGDNVVFSGITLLPPYREKDICTTNPLIALEIKKIIGNMPDDYQPK